MQEYLEALETGSTRTKRRPITDSAVFRLEKALMQLVPTIPPSVAAT